MPDVNIIPSRTTDVFMNVHEKAQFANDITVIFLYVFMPMR